VIGGELVLSILALEFAVVQDFDQLGLQVATQRLDTIHDVRYSQLEQTQEVPEQWVNANSVAEDEISTLRKTGSVVAAEFFPRSLLLLLLQGHPGNQIESPKY
jgi:hypothetical protein